MSTPRTRAPGGGSARLLAAATLCLASLAEAREPKPLETLSLKEEFGVAHAEQIVYLPLARKPDAARTVLLDERGRPVPFQLMRDGRLALRTALPAGTNRQWRVVRGKPGPAAAGGIEVSEGPEGYTIQNGLIGIRVPKASTDPARTPAPIQGLRFQDGTWTATGTNCMARPAKSMTVEFLERGPLVVVVKVSYLYDRALLRSHRPECPEIPAGEGPYSTTLEVQAGQPSIMFEEDCEVDVSYAVDITDGLTPDRAQYRGHHATSAEAGMEADGKIYTYGSNARHDALVNLKFEGKAKDRWSQTSYPFLSHWDPWAVDTGFYWQLYDSRTNGSGNLVAVFAGPASRLVQPGLSGVSFDTATVQGRPRVALQVRFQRLMPTQFYSTRMRFGWGIFLGRKGADLKPPQEVQGVNLQMNRRSGVNLTALAELPSEFPDPREGYGNLYAPPRAWQGVADRLRQERQEGGRAFYGEQYNANPYLGGILQFWADPTPEAAAKAADEVNGFAQDYLGTLANGEGIYRHSTHYFMGASSMSQFILWIDLLLACDPLPAQEKARLKRSAALFAMTLWSHDVAPMQAGCGMNWGPANMAAMWLGTRQAYTLFLSSHPLFARHVSRVRQEVLKMLADYTNEAGACSACAHYTGASMVPILNLLQQMQMRGVTDAFATEPRLAKYAEWEMQLLTPPEARFGGLRKIIAVGDGATEQNVRIGQIGTGFARGNPALSSRLIGAWQAMGRPQDNFYGASLFKIDGTLPAVSPNLGDAAFPGWMTVLRHGWDTKDECAAFFIHGDFQTDHRHTDQGEVILYALGAPISLDFGPTYYPRVCGIYMHSAAVPESALGMAWNADGVPLDLQSVPQACWWRTVASPLASFSASASAGGRFDWCASKSEGQWRRVVRLLYPDPAHPVIVIDDGFDGKDLAGKPVISTLTMMAQGPVNGPAGMVVPVERTHEANQNTTPAQLPSGGAPIGLQPGLNRFSFTGQYGVDWDLYTDADNATQAAIGNWGHKWCPTTEQQQFQKTSGKRFEERQHLFRLRGQDKMRMILLPYRKGDRPEPFLVARQEAATVIRCGRMTLTLAANGFSSETVEGENTRRCLTSFGAEGMEAFGLRLEGGPAELVLDGPAGTLTVSGAAGERKVRLAQGWKPTPRSAAQRTGEAWSVQYDGVRPLVIPVAAAE